MKTTEGKLVLTLTGTEFIPDGSECAEQPPARKPARKEGYIGIWELDGNNCPIALVPASTNPNVIKRIMDAISGEGGPMLTSRVDIQPVRLVTRESVFELKNFLEANGESKE